MQEKSLGINSTMAMNVSTVIYSVFSSVEFITVGDFPLVLVLLDWLFRIPVRKILCWVPYHVGVTMNWMRWLV